MEIDKRNNLLDKHDLAKILIKNSNQNSDSELEVQIDENFEIVNKSEDKYRES